MQINRYDTMHKADKKYSGRYQRERTVSSTATTNRAAVPPHGSYGDLLFDPRWKAKRAEIMSRDQDRCVICRSTENLQVHHRQYQFVKSESAFKVPWDYDNHLLITVCKSCHQRGHNKFKVPILII